MKNQIVHIPTVDGELVDDIPFPKSIPHLLDEMQADTLPNTKTRIAENPFQAAHIANGLKLADCNSLDEARARWRRYRGWKVAGERTQAAYQRAIDGEEPPAPMFVENEAQ